MNPPLQPPPPVPSRTKAAAAQRECARPGCAQPVVRNPRGRPRLYCTPPSDAHAPLLVEVDHGSTTSRGRPAGQVWLVRIRRGGQQAIVAHGLGRPSADHLARQLQEVINPPPLATPARIR
jgi:hypothetical protein